MKSPFKKKNPFAESTVVYDGVSIKLKNNTGPGNDTEDVDVVELIDESGDSMVFEILANAAYLGDNYFITTVYLEEDPDDDDHREVTEVILLKEVFENNESMLDPVSDTALANLIFEAFRKASGDKFEFQ